MKVSALRKWLDGVSDDADIVLLYGHSQLEPVHSFREEDGSGVVLTLEEDKDFHDNES